MASSSQGALSERLRHVATTGNVEEIEQLVRLGALFEADKYGRTALHYAAHCGRVRVIRLCIARGCELDAEDTYGCTALHKAVSPDGHIEAVRALLEEGCAVERHDKNGNTVLHEAAWNGYSQSLDALIKIGKANVHAANKLGQKPIHLACQNGHNQCTRLLLKAGSHPDIKNNSGETPLHIACLFGHVTCARILLSAGCNANTKKEDGNTPLHLAAGLGKQKITRLLLEAQCKVKIKNKNHQTALELARQNDHADVVLLILGARRLRKGKRSFFSVKKKKDDHFGDTDHHHHDDKHGRRDNGEKRDDDNSDDVDGGQGGLRGRGRRELGGGMERHPSGSSRGKSKKNRDKRREEGQLRVEQVKAQNLFVKEELKRKVKSEKKLHQQIQAGREMGIPQPGHPLMKTQLFKDKTGRILEVPMPVQCNCAPYIKKLENQVEASKERLLHEIDLSKARFEGRMNNMEKRMTHQASCLDQLCKERVAAERTECMQRIDRRAKEERERWAQEQDARSDVLRRELRQWFESRIQPLHEQLSRTYLDDSCISASSRARRGRPRAGFYKMHERGMAMGRGRSKSESNISDCDFDGQQDEDDEEESDEEEDDEDEDVVENGNITFVEERLRSSRQPSEQSPHRYKNSIREEEYKKTGAIPKKSRSCSFRQAVSEEDGTSASSSNSGTPLSMVAGVYRPPLVATHERSPPIESRHSLPANFLLPSQETDDSDSTQSESDSETDSQLSLETVSPKPKSISGSTNVSSSTRDSGLHTLKGSSVSSSRRSDMALRGDLIAYQALTVNARPPPPLRAVTNPRPPFNAQPPPAHLRLQTNYTLPFSPPISPSSTASQPLSTSVLISENEQRVITPVTEQASSDNPSPTDSAKTPLSTSSSGVSSGETSLHPNLSPIKYSIVSPHSGQSYQRTYAPCGPSIYQADLLKDTNSGQRAPGTSKPPPPYSGRSHGRSVNVPTSYKNSIQQANVRNANNGNNNAVSTGSHKVTDLAQNGKPHSSAAKSAPVRTFAMIGRPIASPHTSGVNSGVINSTRATTAATTSKSAASRLGVTPSLNGIRGSHLTQPSVGHSTSVSAAGRDANQNRASAGTPNAFRPSHNLGGNGAATMRPANGNTNASKAMAVPSANDPGASDSLRTATVGGAAIGGNASSSFISGVENFNRNAPSQQKLKYTQELFL